MKQVSALLLGVLLASPAQAMDPAIVAAIDSNDMASLKALLQSQRPRGQEAAHILEYAALVGDDNGIQALLAYGVPATLEAIASAGDAIDPRSGYGGHLLTARYLKSVMLNPSIINIKFEHLTIRESSDPGTYRERYRPPLPRIDPTLQLKNVFMEELMKDCIQLCNHQGLEELLKTAGLPRSAVVLGLEAAARTSEDQSMRLLLNYCHAHKEIRVDWDRLYHLATDVDPSAAGSGGHPLLGLYLRSVQKSHGALAEKPLSSFLFQPD